MTTKPQHQAIDLTESADVKMNIKGLWSLIMTIVAATIAIISFQLKTEHRLHDLYIQNQNEHVSIMQKLNDISDRQNLLALKSGVVDAIVFTARQRDQVLGGTNIILKDEIEFRAKLKEFLR